VPLSATLLLARKTGQGTRVRVSVAVDRLHTLPMLQGSTPLPDAFWVCCPPRVQVPAAWHGTASSWLGTVRGGWRFPVLGSTLPFAQGSTMANA